MSLKAINDKAGTFGARVRDLVYRHVALANRLVARDALLPTLSLLGGAQAPGLGKAAPTAPALSGGAVADSAAVRAAVEAIADAATTPTDAEIDAASGGLLDVADRDNVRTAIRMEATLRYVAEWCAARMPANDV